MNGKTLEDYESELWEDPRALLDLIAEEDPSFFKKIKSKVEQIAYELYEEYEHEWKG